MGAPDGGEPHYTAAGPIPAAALSSLGWASMYPAAKVALVEVEPLHIVWARAAIAGLALALITIVSKRGLRRGWARPGLRSGARRCCSPRGRWSPALRV